MWGGNSGSVFAKSNKVTIIHTPSLLVAPNDFGPRCVKSITYLKSSLNLIIPRSHGKYTTDF